MNEHKTQGNDEENDVLSWLKFRVIKHCLKHAFASLFYYYYYYYIELTQ